MKVKVEVCLAVDGDGNWAAVGSSRLDVTEAMRRAIAQVNRGEKQIHLVAEIDAPYVKREPHLKPDTPNSGLPWD